MHMEHSTLNIVIVNIEIKMKICFKINWGRWIWNKNNGEAVRPSDFRLVA